MITCAALYLCIVSQNAHRNTYTNMHTEIRTYYHTYIPKYTHIHTHRIHTAGLTPDYCTFCGLLDVVSGDAQNGTAMAWHIEHVLDLMLLGKQPSQYWCVILYAYVYDART